MSALGLAIFQQITGINTVIYYAPTIFKFAGIKAAGPAILAGAGLTMVMWCFHVLAIFLMDRVGRRPLLLIGVAGQIIGLAILGAAFQFQQLASFKSYIAIGGLVIYVACFAFGLGPIFWLLISEIYPLKVRGAAMSAVTVTNWGLNLVVAVTFLTLVGVLGHAGTFWLYGVIAVAAWVFFYRLVPETKGKSLEQIEEHWRCGKIPSGIMKESSMKPTTAQILTINGGSSSIKFALFEAGDSLRRILEGGIERIGLPEATLRVKGLNQADNFSRSVTAPDHTVAVGVSDGLDRGTHSGVMH